MPIDVDALGLTELIRLRERLAEALVRRYQRTLAVAAVAGDDGSGWAAERLAEAGGTVAATEGGAATVAFDNGERAVDALLELMRSATLPDGSRRPLRAGLHVAAVLTDGRRLAGDAVAQAATLAASAARDELRLTRATYLGLPGRLRARCRAGPPLSGEGGQPIDVLILEWRDRDALPQALRIEETGEVLSLPEKPVISIGRLSANDLALHLPDTRALLRVSRLRHLELRRTADELYVHPLSHLEVEVDGQLVRRGERARAVGGTVVKLAGAATLTFLADASADVSADEAQLQTIAVMPSPEK